MWRPILRGVQELVLQPQCLLCHRLGQRPMACPHLCEPCLQSLSLPGKALQGATPLPWIAAGRYEGRLRSLLLQLRQTRNQALINLLSTHLRATLPPLAVLVPVPSWKRSDQANPLPGLLMHALQREHRPLLQRQRASVGQHHLTGQQRWTNQHNSFRCVKAASADMNWRQHQAWIVDDIVTTGATAWSAAHTLRAVGIPVAGVVCLGRTPRTSPPADHGALRFAGRADNAPG